jgi:hypothetical protein
MRSITILSTALFGLGTVAALAQTPWAQNPATSAHPGHEFGIGDSLPRSNNASNISPADTRSVIAPTLPGPLAGDSGTPAYYLLAAKAALAAGHNGAAQQSLEMAETRTLDRSVAPGTTDRPSGSQLVNTIRGARHAIGEGNKPHAMDLIDKALSS